MSLRDAAEFVTGVEVSKIIPKNTDGSTPLPYVGKTEVVGFSGLGPFDFSGASDISAVPLTIKKNNVAETKTLDLSGAVSSSAVTVTELIAAITTAAFTAVTAAVDSRGYGKITLTGAVAISDYIQIYGEAAILGGFGQGYGLKFRTLDTQKSFPFIPTNVDDAIIETIDSNGKKTSVITPGYRDGLTATLVDSAVDDDLRALLNGGSWDETTKTYLPPLSDAERALLSIEVVNKRFLKNSNQKNDWIGATITRAYSMSSKEDGAGTGDNNFQDMSYSFSGTEYTDPETKTKYSDSMTKGFTRAEYEALDYVNI